MQQSTRPVVINLEAQSLRVLVRQQLLTVGAAEPKAGYAEVLLTGEPEWRCEHVRAATGIPVPVQMWTKPAAIAA